MYSFILGVLYVTGHVDREVQETYNLNVTVDDGKYTASTTVAITVTDTNDHAPQFNLTTQRELTLKFSENWGPGVVFQFNATDEDLAGSNNSQIIYNITNGKVVVFVVYHLFNPY